MATTLVLDATPLIYLTRIGFWKHLRKFGWKLATTDGVARELMLEEKMFPETTQITELIKGKALAVLPAPSKSREVPGLSAEDVGVVRVAKKMNAVAVLDDSPARHYALSLGVRTVHSTALLVEGVRKKAFSAEKALGFLDAMVDAGWYCDVETYKNIAEAIRREGKTDDAQ